MDSHNLETVQQWMSDCGWELAPLTPEDLAVNPTCCYCGEEIHDEFSYRAENDNGLDDLFCCIECADSGFYGDGDRILPAPRHQVETPIVALTHVDFKGAAFEEDSLVVALSRRLRRAIRIVRSPEWSTALPSATSFILRVAEEACNAVTDRDANEHVVKEAKFFIKLLEPLLWNLPEDFARPFYIALLGSARPSENTAGSPLYAATQALLKMDRATISDELLKWVAETLHEFSSDGVIFDSGFIPWKGMNASFVLAEMSRTDGKPVSAEVMDLLCLIMTYDPEQFAGDDMCEYTPLVQELFATLPEESVADALIRALWNRRYYRQERIIMELEPFADRGNARAFEALLSVVENYDPSWHPTAFLVVGSECWKKHPNGLERLVQLVGKEPVGSDLPAHFLDCVKPEVAISAIFTAIPQTELAEWVEECICREPSLIQSLFFDAQPDMRYAFVRILEAQLLRWNNWAHKAVCALRCDANPQRRQHAIDVFGPEAQPTDDDQHEA